jgi:hypothetical protein
MLRETLKDSAQIIQTILTQPLSIPGAAEGVSLLSSAENFDPNNPADSDFKRVIATFLAYPEATERMIQELELIRHDLSV